MVYIHRYGWEVGKHGVLTNWWTGGVFEICMPRHFSPSQLYKKRKFSLYTLEQIYSKNHCPCYKQLCMIISYQSGDETWERKVCIFIHPNTFTQKCQAFTINFTKMKVCIQLPIESNIAQATESLYCTTNTAEWCYKFNYQNH